MEHHLRGRQPLIIYSSHPQFEQTNAISGVLGQGTGGVTEPLKRRIVLPFGGPLSETDHVIGHELVHAFQFDITGERGGETVFRASGATRLPLWFIEGMAEFLSLGPEDLPHIFDRFFRVKKDRSRQTGGSGLGLTICKLITRAHHGEIKARCEENKGCRFTVKLPAARET